MVGYKKAAAAAVIKLILPFGGSQVPVFIRYVPR